MSKKLKITEEQLKSLIRLKEQSQGIDDFDTQVQPEELSSTDYDAASEMNDANSELDRMTDSFIKQYKEKATHGIDDDMINGLCDKIRQGLGAEPGYDEERQEEINYGINESVIKIKSEFNRFL
jgi:hypothetical protein